jgi:hypothetical protein
MIYKMVQTGPNTQLGGLKIGFSSVGYQFAMLDLVGILDKKPTIRHVNVVIVVLPQLIFFKI